MNVNRVFRIGVVAILILVFLVVTGSLVLRSRAFHSYLLTTIVERAQKATGARVELGDFTLRLSGLRADLYRLALHGTESDSQIPLLRVEHLGVGLKIVSLWKRQIDLEEIIIDHPVVNFSVDEHGHNNIPQAPPPSPGSKPVNVFDLAIGHFVLNQGEIYYNDRQTPLNAEVRDLQTQVSFDTSKKEYDGSINYRQARVRIAEYNPLQHDLEAKFTAAASGLTLSSLRLRSGSSRITAQARLQDYTRPSVDGSYNIVVSTAEAAGVLKNDSLPTGEVSTKGTVHYRNKPDEPFLNSLSVQGQLSSPALNIESPQARAGIRAVRGDYRLSEGSLEARNLEADILGGHLAAELTMRQLATEPQARLAATLSGVSLADASAALRSRPQGNLQITGRVDGKVDATWRGSMKDLQLSSDATIAASALVPPATGSGTTAIPFDGAAHLAYNSRVDIISLRQSWFRTAHAGVTLDGAIGRNSTLGILARSDDLREIDVLLLTLQEATAKRTRAESKPPELLGLGGSVSFNGQMSGPMKNLRMTGHVSGANVRYRSTSLPALRTDIALSASALTLSQGELQTSANGRVQFDAAVGLRNWSYTPNSPLKLKVAANRVPMADLKRIANLHYPVTGIISVNVSAQGSQLNPVGQGSVQLSQASAWDQPIQELAIRFQGTGKALQSNINLHTPAGSASAKLTFLPKQQQYEAQLDVPGIQLDQLEPVRARNLPVTGVLKVSARGRGTLKAPQLEAVVEAPKLTVRDQKLDGLNIHAGVAGQQGTFSVDSKVVGAFVQARGSVNLNSDYEATINLDTQGVQLGPLLASFSPERANDLRGQTELHGRLKGPLKRPERLEGRVEIPTLSVGYQSVQIANASPIRIAYRGGIVTLERAELKGTETDLQMEAVLPLRNGGNLRAAVTGNVDLHILQLLNPQVDSSGRARLDVAAQGTRARPEIHGGVRIINAAFQAPGAPLGVQNVNAEFGIQKDRVDIKSFSAESGGGNITAQGFAIYQPTVQFNVAASAKEVRLRYPEGVRAVLTSNLTLNGTPESALLNGKVFIDRLSFTQAFDLATFADQFSGPSSPPSEGIAQNIKLDLALSSTREMALRSSTVSVQGSTDLRVRGTAAEPVILGRSNITGGELFFNDRRYQVQNGVIQFVNPVRTEPIVNLLVTTTVDQFNLSLSFVGPIDRLRTTYTSDPPLPPVDIINLLVTGRTTQAASASPTTPQSVLAGQLAGQVSSKVGKLAGISSLKIDPQIGGSGGNAGARLAMQQRVTRNLFFTFATDVTSTQGQVVQAEYQVTRKYSLSALRNQNGGYSVQIKMRKRF